MLTAGTPLGSPDGMVWARLKAGVLGEILDKHRLVTSGILVFTLYSFTTLPVV